MNDDLFKAKQQFSTRITSSLEERSASKNGPTETVVTAIDKQVTDQVVYGAKFIDQYQDPQGRYWVLARAPLNCMLDAAEGVLLSCRLPTEAEWEYAARGGRQAGGYNIYAGSDSMSGVAWSAAPRPVNDHAVIVGVPWGNLCGGHHPFCLKGFRIKGAFMEKLKNEFKITVTTIVLLCGVLFSLSAQEDVPDYSNMPLVGVMDAVKGVMSADDLEAALRKDPSDNELITFMARQFSWAMITDWRKITTLKPKETRHWGPLLKKLPELVLSPDPRLRAWARLLWAGADGVNDAPSAAFPRIEQAVNEPHDWEAFSIYRTAGERGEELTEAEVLACLDQKRPSLAAAVLEDYFSLFYFERKGAQADFGQEYINKVIEKCLLLYKIDYPRAAVAPLMTVRYFGKADYIDEYVVLLSSPLPIMRRLAYKGLIRFADTRLYNYLIQGLKDENKTVRIVCIDGLGGLRDTRAIAPLSKILMDDTEDSEVREAAARALGEIGDRSLAARFKNILLVPRGSASDYGIRMLAASRLGVMQERTAVEALLANIIVDGYDGVTRECLRSLGKIRSETAAEKLEPIILDGWDEFFEYLYSDSNGYYAVYALFTHPSEELGKRYLSLVEENGDSYRPTIYMAAYYLIRMQKQPSPAAADYIKRYRDLFFEKGYNVYEFCVLLKGRWDRPTLTYLAERIDQYSENYKTWLLSSLDAQPSLAYWETVKKVWNSERGVERAWGARLFYSIIPMAKKLTGEDRDKYLDEMRELLEKWRKNETDGKTKSWLDSAERML